MNSRTRPKKRRAGVLLAGLTVCFGGLLSDMTAHAQSSAEEAVELFARYIMIHNSHDLDATMAFYAPDATFQLSFGRELVRGRPAIAELERFDIAAQSALFPFGMTAEQENGGDAGDAGAPRWRISVAGVVESSIIFSATGMKVVIALPEKPVAIVAGGRIVHQEQPPVGAACVDIAGQAFAGTARWLVEQNDERVATLVADGRLLLRPPELPQIARAIEDWRAAMGWSPALELVMACGSIPDSVLGS